MAAKPVPLIGACMALLLLPGPALFADPHLPPKMIQVSEGIVLFVTPAYGDVGLDGNAIAILSKHGVLVFDSNGTPAAAAAVLAGIRRLTDQPVRYLVQSHWHWDHWYGAEVYQQAFPDVIIIAHESTRALMMGPALAFNEPGLTAQLPDYIRSLEKRVAAARAAHPPPDDLPQIERLLEEDRFFLAQKTAVHHTFPNLTFTDRLNLYLDDRSIQVLHYDRAVTPGDAFLYLPNEKIVITGDLLVNPISFALGAYPSGWLATLERIDRLDASILVPGHGEPLHDKELLHATMDLFRELLRQGRESKAEGLDPDQAKAKILPSLEPLMRKLTKGDPVLEQQCRVYLVDWYLHRVYDELDGPLSDAIKSPPPS
jgi:glyoxylase-like metal-dependent hydrolase (beta-lactamase superfamily II)